MFRAVLEGLQFFLPLFLSQKRPIYWLRHRNPVVGLAVSDKKNKAQASYVSVLLLLADTEGNVSKCDTNDSDETKLIFGSS